jgi:hypothetical protein
MAWYGRALSVSLEVMAKNHASGRKLQAVKTGWLVRQGFQELPLPEVSPLPEETRQDSRNSGMKIGLYFV